MALTAGLAKRKQLSIVFASGEAQSASWQGRASVGDSKRHATASGAKRNRRHLTPLRFVPSLQLALPNCKRRSAQQVARSRSLVSPSLTKKSEQKEQARYRVPALFVEFIRQNYNLQHDLFCSEIAESVVISRIITCKRNSRYILSSFVFRFYLIFTVKSAESELPRDRRFKLCIPLLI